MSVTLFSALFRRFKILHNKKHFKTDYKKQEKFVHQIRRNYPGDHAEQAGRGRRPPPGWRGADRVGRMGRRVQPGQLNPSCLTPKRAASFSTGGVCVRTSPTFPHQGYLSAAEKDCTSEAQHHAGVLSATQSPRYARSAATPGCSGNKCTGGEQASSLGPYCKQVPLPSVLAPSNQWAAHLAPCFSTASAMWTPSGEKKLVDSGNCTQTTSAPRDIPLPPEMCPTVACLETCALSRSGVTSTEDVSPA